MKQKQQRVRSLFLVLLSQKDSTFTQGHMDDLLCLKSIQYLWRQKHPSVKKSMRLKLEDDIKIQQRPDLHRANLSCIEPKEACEEAGLRQPPDLWSIVTTQHSSTVCLTQATEVWMKIRLKDTSWLMQREEMSRKYLQFKTGIRRNTTDEGISHHSSIYNQTKWHWTHLLNKG